MFGSGSRCPGAGLGVRAPPGEGAGDDGGVGDVGVGGVVGVVGAGGVVGVGAVGVLKNQLPPRGELTVPSDALTRQ